MANSPKGYQLVLETGCGLSQEEAVQICDVTVWHFLQTRPDACDFDHARLMRSRVDGRLLLLFIDENGLGFAGVYDAPDESMPDGAINWRYVEGDTLRRMVKGDSTE